MIDFGTVRPGTTLYIPFATYDSNDPSASVTLTGLAATDIEIYKDGSVTQRASDNGYTLLDTDGIDFDAVTGIHGFSVNLADNSTAGFYSSGSQYWVVVASVTVDAATINFIAATFSIGYPDAIVNTTIATLASQTSFTLTAGSAEDDAYNGCPVFVHDVASAVQVCAGYVSDYTGSTKTVTLAADPGIFTMAATDNIAIFMPVNVRAVAGLVTNGTNLGSACANYSATRGLTGTALPAAAADAAGGLIISDAGALDADTQLVTKINSILDDTGTAGVVVASLAAGSITATVIADNAIDTATFAAGTTIPRCTLVDTLTTYTGNTVQTGDSYAIVNSGTHGNAAIKGFVDDIGVAGAGLTAVPWNAAWDAEVQSEVEDAIVVHRLDELLNADSDIDGAAPPTVGSVFHELMTKTAGSFTYDQTTDSLEALRDRGDAAWITATGFSTHSAADVWAAATRTLTTIAAATLAGATADKIADHVRRRTQANVEASSDGDAVSLGSEYGMIQQAQESSASGGTLTVFKTDGSTSLGTKTLTTDAAADPITAIA